MSYSTSDGYGDCRPNWITAVALTADGSRALSGSADRTLKLWDLSTGTCLRTLEGHANWVEAVAFAADGSRALSCSEDRTLKLWDLSTGTCLATWHADGAVYAIAASGSRIVIGDATGAVSFLELLDAPSPALAPPP